MSFKLSLNSGYKCEEQKSLLESTHVASVLTSQTRKRCFKPMQSYMSCTNRRGNTSKKSWLVQTTVFVDVDKNVLYIK